MTKSVKRQSNNLKRRIPGEKLKSARKKRNEANLLQFRNFFSYNVKNGDELLLLALGGTKN